MSDPSNASDYLEVDISPLGRALGQLEQAIAAWVDKPADDFIRDAIIQRFEFTYELSVRTLRRYVNSIAASEADLTFKELIRQGADLRLLRGDVLNWLDFRQARTDTVHTYNEFRAKEVANVAKDFALEARFLFDTLSRRIER